MGFGILGGYVFTSRPDTYAARATLAMLPSPDVSVAETPAFWEVLNAGQATRSAAIVLGDNRWLDSAATAAGVRKSTLTLTAGAIPQTTLITISMKASSAAGARSALEAVLGDAVGLAAKTAGPFELRVISPPSVQTLSPMKNQVFAAASLAGFLAGAGIGLFIARIVPQRRRHEGSIDTIDDLPSLGNQPRFAEV